MGESGHRASVHKWLGLVTGEYPRILDRRHPRLGAPALARSELRDELGAQAGAAGHVANQGSQSAAANRRSQKVPAGNNTSFTPRRKASKAFL
jgi:hypothetical protein